MVSSTLIARQLCLPLQICSLKSVSPALYICTWIFSVSSVHGIVSQGTIVCLVIWTFGFDGGLWNPYTNQQLSPTWPVESEQPHDRLEITRFCYHQNIARLKKFVIPLQTHNMIRKDRTITDRYQ